MLEKKRKRVLIKFTPSALKRLNEVAKQENFQSASECIRSIVYKFLANDKLEYTHWLTSYHFKEDEARSELKEVKLDLRQAEALEEIKLPLSTIIYRILMMKLKFGIPTNETEQQEQQDSVLYNSHRKEKESNYTEQSIKKYLDKLASVQSFHFNQPMQKKSVMVNLDISTISRIITTTSKETLEDYTINQIISNHLTNFIKTDIQNKDFNEEAEVQLIDKGMSDVAGQISVLIQISPIIKELALLYPHKEEIYPSIADRIGYIIKIAVFNKEEIV